MILEWDDEKNRVLQIERNISFERIAVAIQEHALLDILEHPNKKDYPNQYLIILEIDHYAWVVPSLRTEKSWVLKTAFPSRKYTDHYLPGRRK